MTTLGQALDSSVEVVERAFGPVTVFEHGPSRPGRAPGCGVDHLHVHLVPLPFDLKGAMEALFPMVHWSAVRGLEAAQLAHQRGEDYL